MSRLDLATEQKIWRSFKRLPHPPRRILMAVSGGIDSLVMAEILWKWRVGMGLELAVAHVHHGLTADREQLDYRNRAQSFVRAWAKTRKLPFFTNRKMTSADDASEASLRALRHGWLRKWREREAFDAIAFAHHQDDLLETRVLRLIRGSGAQGMKAMAFFRSPNFRPLLGLSSREIRAYADLTRLQWVDDPSNASTDLLRNWLRRQWLPSLETRRPGSLVALARSLDSLSPDIQEFDLGPYVGLRREAIFMQSSREQKALLARYLHSLGLRNYAQTHVDEILKRLGTRRKNFTFAMLGLQFHISPDFLWASRV